MRRGRLLTSSYGGWNGGQIAQLATAEVDVVIERALAELPFDDWRVIDTRREVRGPRVDFVVVGPPGVFVIGCVRRTNEERTRAKQLMTLLDSAHAVADVAGVRRDEVHPVLCLTGGQPDDSWSRGVSVCGIVNLADTLTFKRAPVGTDEVEAGPRWRWAGRCGAAGTTAGEVHSVALSGGAAGVMPAS